MGAPPKAAADGSEWAVVAVMIFAFVIGFALGGGTIYVAMKLKEKPA